jgi:hypothetical protein
MVTTAEAQESQFWQTYVSWNQFAWLYLVSLLAALRGVLLWQAHMPGAEIWGMASMVLASVAFLLRYWVRYAATSRGVLIINAFTGREIQAINWEHVSDMAVKQGVMDWILGIGTIVFKSTRVDDVMQFRGISDPEATLRDIQTVRRRRIFPGS